MDGHEGYLMNILTVVTFLIGEKSYLREIVGEIHLFVALLLTNLHEVIHAVDEFFDIFLPGKIFGCCILIYVSHDSAFAHNLRSCLIYRHFSGKTSEALYQRTEVRQFLLSCS